MIGLASADCFHYRLSCTTGRYNIKNVRNSIKWQWERRHYYYCTAAPRPRGSWKIGNHIDENGGGLRDRASATDNSQNEPNVRRETGKE
jgi:hypothetical protein